MAKKFNSRELFQGHFFSRLPSYPTHGDSEEEYFLSIKREDARMDNAKREQEFVNFVSEKYKIYLDGDPRMKRDSCEPMFVYLDSNPDFAMGVISDYKSQKGREATKAGVGCLVAAGGLVGLVSQIPSKHIRDVGRGIHRAAEVCYLTSIGVVCALLLGAVANSIYQNNFSKRK